MTRKKNPTIYKTWEDAPAVLTTGQAAILLQLHLNTVVNMIQDGRMPAVKFGKNWRIDKGALQAMFDPADALEEAGKAILAKWRAEGIDRPSMKQLYYALVKSGHIPHDQNVGTEDNPHYERLCNLFKAHPAFWKD